MIDPYTLTWRRVPHAEAALERALAPWLGTPYRVGQQAPGVGVDCVRFVCAVLDSVTKKRTPIHTLPQDAALHARTSAILAMKKIKRLYEPNEEATDGAIESGDLLITAHPGGGPGHVLIAGAKPWHLWESTMDGVHRTGLGGLAPMRLDYVYRPKHKERWA